MLASLSGRRAMFFSQRVTTCERVTCNFLPPPSRNSRRASRTIGAPCELHFARRENACPHLKFLAFAVERCRINAENRRRFIQGARARYHPPNMLRLDLLHGEF